MSGLLQDLRYALRQLRRSPGFAVFAVLVMALGIGSTTAMFSILHTVLLKPLAYRDPERLVILSRQITPVRFDEMKAASRSYSDLGAYAGIIEDMALSGEGTPEVLSGARVSGNFLQVLGASPLKGRSFLEQEDKPGSPAVAIISENLWTRRFSRDPAIIGKGIDLAGVRHTIVGVMPVAFQFPFAGLDVWITRPSELAQMPLASRPISPTLKVFGRLKPGITIRQAAAELAVLKGQYAAAHPGMLDAKSDSSDGLVPLKDEIVSDVRAELWMLFGAVGLVLLIVCANLGSLLLARATSRAREFAVRAALGAGSAQILRQLLAESALLSVIGGFAGLALAGFALRAIRGLAFIDLPRAGEIHLDGVVLGFAIALSVMTGVLFGFAPSLVALRPTLADVLRGNGESLAAARMGMRLAPRELSVAAQVALSIVLLIGATLLIESMAHLARVDPGFQATNLLTMQLSLSTARYNSDEKLATFYEQVVEHVESLPGVRSAAVSLTLPFKGWAGVPVQRAAGPPMKLNERPISVMQFITPEYFLTMGVGFKRGREFNAHDDLKAPLVAIINESLAKNFWPQYPAGPDPVGQHLLVGNNRRPIEVVGICADVREVSKDEVPRLEVYLPRTQSPNRLAALIVRTNGDPLALAAAVQKEVLAVDPEQPVSDVESMDQVEESSEGQLDLVMRMLTAFAGVATLLAIVGLYGVISYWVVRRTREIGIRQALGAEQRKIVALVIMQGLRPSVVGLILGVGAAFGLTRFLRDLLYQVSAVDPMTFFAVAALFLVVAMLACYVPARRATKVDPMIALRYE
jgi:putative ABC transport system permease protein